MDQVKDKKPKADKAAGPVAQKEGRRRRVPVASLIVSPLREPLPGVAKRGKKAAPKAEARICIYQGQGGANRVFAGLAAFAAAKARGDELVEVFDFGPLTLDEARELVLLTLLRRERGCPFRITEQLEAFMKAHQNLKTTRDLGQRFGCTHTTIERYLGLRKLPVEVFKAGLGGDLRPSHAYLLHKVKDEGDLHHITQSLIEGDKEERKEAASALRNMTRPAKATDGYPAWQRLRKELVQAWHTCATEDRPKVVAELRELLTSLDPAGAREAAHVA